uniref:Ig-like domain-containing protein n=1 Tax=Poecilia reticulata TaxID=8081 RepID=A0A3P9MZW1_POERE
FFIITKCFLGTRFAKATLTAKETTIPAGGSVTLTCSVNGSTDLYINWDRNGHYHAAGPSRDTEPDRTIRVSEGGEYSCRGLGRGGYLAKRIHYFGPSNKVIIWKTGEFNPNKPSLILQPNWSQICRGEKVTLRCEIQDDGGTQWTYEWRTTNRNSPTSSQYRINSATDADSGEYSCRGNRDYNQTEWSDSVRLTVKPDKPTATLTAMETVIPAGGSVTLTCSVVGSTGWKFDWFRNGLQYPAYGNTEPDGSIRVSEGGEYSCRGGRGDPVFYSGTSYKVTIQRTARNKPSLVLQPNWSQIYRGEKVTLRCEIQGGTQWTYEWRPTNRNSPTRSEYRINSATDADSGEYSCRGNREGFFLTPWSDVVNLTVYPHPAASLSVNPDRVQHFRSESVSLSCEGNSAKWRVMRFMETELSNCSYWGNLTGTTCTINPNRFNSGVYWCESKSGEFSNAVNITVQDDSSAPLLLSPVHPVTEGDPVTLRCRDKTQNLFSNVFFYHNDKLLHNDSREELKISAVSKSDEGFYKCQHSGKDSPRSWMSVRGEEEENVVSGQSKTFVLSFFTHIQIVYFHNAYKSVMFRLNQPESINPASATNHGVTQNDGSVYSSLLHGSSHIKHLYD